MSPATGIRHGVADQHDPDAICVVGAGLSGLAALHAPLERGLDAECFERGSAVGGSWRYENDSGLSAAYASLRTNSSRRNTQFPGFPMPASYGDFMHWSDMAAYLESFAAAFGLDRRIRFRTSVEWAEPQGDGWLVRLSGGEERRYRAVVVAVGHYWSPSVPDFPGEFSGEAIHSRDYRIPDPYAGKRVVVVGAGQSALDIAAEVSTVADRTILACRRSHHILPRYLGRMPLDHVDRGGAIRLPWPLARRGVEAAISLAQAWPERGGLPEPDHPLLEHTWPAVATDEMIAALSSGAVAVKPDIERLMQDEIRFGDGSQEPVDAIIYATGYRISFPFLPPELAKANGTQFPLYRRIVSPHAQGPLLHRHPRARPRPAGDRRAPGSVAGRAAGRPHRPACTGADVDRDRRRRTAYATAIPKLRPPHDLLRPSRLPTRAREGPAPSTPS
jgi:dimethylaniline monooxygenase (N-oxide forming)